ncbi:TPA: ribose 5-phosphate isomerase B [Candidatus Poribacteria bacterium]|nr:ribose 5-phosphate isomerase B [Candidatus Poribacteria bacterium]
MKIAIGSDHAGFELKEEIKKILKEKGYEFTDFGAKSLDPQDDYPEYGKKVAEAVSSGKYDRGIAICGTGIGISIAANKVPNIRASVAYNTEMAKISRLHNDANVLALGGRVKTQEPISDILTVWLETPFSGDERHKRRINQIKEIEKSKSDVKC